MKLKVFTAIALLVHLNVISAFKEFHETQTQLETQPSRQQEVVKPAPPGMSEMYDNKMADNKMAAETDHHNLTEPSSTEVKGSEEIVQDKAPEDTAEGEMENSETSHHENDAPMEYKSIDQYIIEFLQNSDKKMELLQESLEIEDASKSIEQMLALTDMGVDAKDKALRGLHNNSILLNLTLNFFREAAMGEIRRLQDLKNAVLPFIRVRLQEQREMSMQLDIALEHIQSNYNIGGIFCQKSIAPFFSNIKNLVSQDLSHLGIEIPAHIGVKKQQSRNGETKRKQRTQPLINQLLSFFPLSR